MTLFCLGSKEPPRRILNSTLQIGKKVSFFTSGHFREGAHSIGSSADSGDLILILCYRTPQGFWIRPWKLEYSFLGQGPILQGLRQILMTSFCFGPEEPQRDCRLDPGSWNEIAFLRTIWNIFSKLHVTVSSPDFPFIWNRKWCVNNKISFERGPFTTRTPFNGNLVQ